MFVFELPEIGEGVVEGHVGGVLKANCHPLRTRGPLVVSLQQR